MEISIDSLKNDLLSLRALCSSLDQTLGNVIKENINLKSEIFIMKEEDQNSSKKFKELKEELDKLKNNNSDVVKEE